MLFRSVAAYNITRASDTVITFTDYVFEGENALSMRKGTDGKFRPKNAMTTCMFMTGRKLVVEKKAFSVVEEKESEGSSVFEFSDIAPLAIEDKALEENGGVLVKYHTLEIKDRSGNILLHTPIPQSSIVYDRISDINREIRAAHRSEK